MPAGRTRPGRRKRSPAMTAQREKAHVLDEAGLDRALTRIAHEIIEQAEGVDHIALVGIKTRGVTLAERIARKIATIEGTKPSVGALLKRIHVECPRFLSYFLVMDIFRSGPDALGVF